MSDEIYGVSPIEVATRLVEKPTGVIITDHLLSEADIAILRKAVREFDGSMPIAEYLELCFEETQFSIGIRYIKFEEKEPNQASVVDYNIVRRLEAVEWHLSEQGINELAQAIERRIVSRLRYGRNPQIEVKR